MELKRAERRQLAEWLNYKNVDLTLLYKASRDGSSDATFHETCNFKGPTLTVLYTTTGYVYGLYTVQGFTSDGTWQYDHCCFLFRFREDNVHNPLIIKATTKARVFNHSSFGPTVGNGSSYDFYAFRNAKNFQTEDGITFVAPCTCLQNVNDCFDWDGHQPTDLNGGVTRVLDIQVYSVKGE